MPRPPKPDPSESQFDDFPGVPKDLRPKPLYITRTLPFKDARSLEAKGWLVKDVRLLPSESDPERAEAVKAYLEGVRIGSIAPEASRMKHVELEARILGLLINKERADNERVKLDPEMLDNLLDFGASDTRKQGHISPETTA